MANSSTATHPISRCATRYLICCALREITLNGTPKEVIEQAAQWPDCGVRYMVLINGGPLQRSLRKGLASLRPFNKIIRGIKRL